MHSHHGTRASIHQELLSFKSTPSLSLGIAVVSKASQHSNWCQLALADANVCICNERCDPRLKGKGCNFVWVISSYVVWRTSQNKFENITISGIRTQNGEIALWPSTNGAIVDFLVLPGSLLSITEITEYRYFSSLKPIRELEYNSE